MCLKEDNLFLEKIVLNSEATFHLRGKVNRHNLTTCGSQNLHQVIKHVQDSPKTNVFSNAEATIKGHKYLDMLERFLVPQLDINNLICQQDEALPQYHRNVTWYLYHTFPGRWVDCGCYILWPPTSPDLTAIDFSFWVL
jgi:hypothetical protein